MSFIYPALSAVLEASALVTDKVTMSIRRVTYRTFNGVSFPLAFLFTLIAVLIFRPSFSYEVFQFKYFVLLLVSIALVAIINIIFYRALKKDTLGEIEVIGLLSKVPLIIFAGIIFVNERNPVTMTLAILATVAVVWSHWEKHHFHIAKRTMPLLLWTILVAPFGGIIYKTLLEVWHPITLVLVTDGIVALIFVPLFFKSIKSAPRKSIPLIVLSNLLATGAAILYLISFQVSGIIYTVLIFSLQPILVYLSAMFFLKEKHNPKKTIAFIIILLAIIAAQLSKVAS